MFYELKNVLTRDGFTSIILTLNLQHNNNPPRSSCEPRRFLCFYATGRVISMPLRNWFPMRYLRLRGLPMLSSTKIWLTSTCFPESYFFLMKNEEWTQRYRVFYYWTQRHYETKFFFGWRKIQRAAKLLTKATKFFPIRKALWRLTKSLVTFVSRINIVSLFLCV